MIPADLRIIQARNLFRGAGLADRGILPVER